MRMPILVFSTLVIGMLADQVALACSCLRSSVAEGFQSSKAVFAGKVTHRDVNERFMTVEVKFAVDQAGREFRARKP
jgi:hypothetical protein